MNKEDVRKIVDEVLNNRQELSPVNKVDLLNAQAAIFRSFSWDSTEEGAEYWSKVGEALDRIRCRGR